MSSQGPSKFTGKGLEDVLGPMPAAVVVVDAPSRRILYSNARAREMTEGRLGRPTPRDVTDDWKIFHPDGRPYRMEEWPLVRSLATGEEVVEEEYFNILPDGTRLIVRCSCSPVYGDEGDIVAAVLVMRDITKERHAEQQLTYHASLTDIMEDAVVGTDADFRLTVWNHGAERLYGYAAAEVLGRDARDVASYSGDTSRLELERELLETDRIRTEITAYRKDGTPVDVELISVAVRGPEREITGYLGLHRDMTDRKRGQDALERSARRHAAVAELGLQALASDDLQSLMDGAAAMCARMLEVELVGIHELRAGAGELVLRAGVGWRDGAVGRATTVTGRGSPMGYTLMVGEPLITEDIAADARFAGSPLPTDRGAAAAVCVRIEGRHEPFGVVGAFAPRPRSFSAMDVDFVQAIANVLATAVERAQAAERLIAVREVERRRIARGLHDEALQELSETLAQAAVGGPGPGGAENRLARLVPALERIGLQLRGAIYDLRLGGEEDRPFPELLDELVHVQRGLAGGGEIHLDVGDGVPAGPLGRRGTEVLRIVGEAVINARRHADASHVRVEISGSARRLHVEVADDGRGFDMRRRSNGARGTGLEGMRERAALLGGDLTITSRPGAGTRIRLELVLTGAPEAAERQEARILLVEDHVAVREAMAAMFEREPDFTVVGQARSLAEAREMLHEVDVAVLDLGLPDGDGADLIDELREASPGAQALVLSAGLDRAQTARAIERGAAATLDKTAHLGEVVDVVRRLRAGEAVLAVDEVVQLLRFAGRQREHERTDRDAIERLTAREREVLQALGDGLDSQAIAQQLSISIRTQRNHVASILTKLGVHSQLQAVLFALRYDVIDVG